MTQPTKTPVEEMLTALVAAVTAENSKSVELPEPASVTAFPSVLGEPSKTEGREERIAARMANMAVPGEDPAVSRRRAEAYVDTQDRVQREEARMQAEQARIDAAAHADREAALAEGDQALEAKLVARGDEAVRIEEQREAERERHAL